MATPESAGAEQSAGAKVVTVSHRYQHPAERVYDAWLNPDIARQWLFTMANSEVVVCNIDARVGGKFRIVDRREQHGDVENVKGSVKLDLHGDTEHVGEYLELDPPRRIVFNFAVPQFSPDYTKVIIDIQPTQSGCELTLRHEGVLPDWADRTEQGWGMLLGQLEQTLGQPNF
jgi:uncharacterized protein YndB with AHSA1/START domain